MSLISLIRPQPIPHGGTPVPGATRRTAFEVSGYSLQSNLAELGTDHGNANSRVAANPVDGSVKLIGDKQAAPEGFEVMPLRLSALQKAMAKIEDREEWLMSSPPIVKTEQNGNARIDFINLGGFVFNQKGEYISHSVNAW